MLLWEAKRLSMEIGLAHVLDWAKYVGTKILSGCLLFPVCRSLIFSMYVSFPVRILS